MLHNLAHMLDAQFTVSGHVFFEEFGFPGNALLTLLMLGQSFFFVLSCWLSAPAPTLKGKSPESNWLGFPVLQA